MRQIEGYAFFAPACPRGRGMITYLGEGVFKHGRRELRAERIGMIAGGTGITPMLQIIAAVLKEPEGPEL